MKNRIKNYLSNKSGMSLVEVLTAMAILSLMIFCFTPLFLTYFKSIIVAGNEIKEINTNSGIMQTVIGMADSGGISNYSASVAEVPLQLQVAGGTTIYRTGKTQTAISGDATAQLGDDLNDFQGDFLYTDKEDLLNSYITVNGAGTGSAMTCFPSSLTDDFYKASITLCATGFNFQDLSRLSITCNGEILNIGTDYEAKIINEQMLLLTVYGGGKVSFETSPMVVSYGSFDCEIEVDAPMMIMVGEANAQDEYHYYVSRGELDEDGNLIVIQREMNSTDPTLGDISLNSAMNDVEWVPAAKSDGKGVATGSDPYGYYVMCGDEGQIRRFWKNNTTGNYYWGGDYTYDTDIEINKTDTSNVVNDFASTYVYGTAVDYEYSFHSLSAADTGGTGANGFNLGTNKTVYLQSNNIWSVTAYGNDASDYIYTSDGKLYQYQTGRWRKNVFSGYQAYGQSLLTLADVQSLGTGTGTYNSIPVSAANNLGVTNREDYTWLKADNSGYYTLNGLSTSTNPITLTSVDAIVISDTASSGYYSGIETSGTHYYGTGDWADTDYPSASYTLYCGYIPAAMDLWSTKSGIDTGWKGHMTKDSNADNNPTVNAPTSSIFTRKYSVIYNSNTERYGYWRGNFGISPYYLDDASTSMVANQTGQIVYYHQYSASAVGGYEYPGEHLVYYPYTNVGYALTGKLYDATAFSSVNSTDILKTSRLAPTAGYSYSTWSGKQQHITNGDVVDITIAYLSHPFAVHIATNPTDDVVYDQSHDKENDIFYWNNSRETITYLDCASTNIPNGEKDIPVSLMGGYVMGGLVEYVSDVVYANTVMNNGIIMLRAGQTETGKHGEGANFLEEVANIFGSNSATEEWYGKDSTGWKLDAESNVFHQFYYLNSRTTSSTSPKKDLTAKNVGNLYGANYWQNNRHIDFVSTNGGVPAGTKNADGTVTVDSTNYNYLRCHPLSNTKVNCVCWGTTWQGFPEAMWGTDNGTLISWDVDLNAAASGSSHDWNDRSVDAEFQSYQWVDNVNGNTFAVRADSKWIGTIGSGSGTSADDKTQAGTTFSNTAINGTAFAEFADRCSRDVGTLYGAAWQNATSFISVLDSVNDIAFANDTWVAVGDWSGKNPADYCGTGATLREGYDLVPYTDGGKGGSWVNVKYWVDVTGTGRKTSDNSTYLWKAVKISNNEKYNIVQINCLNGMWIATGYVDEDGNGVQDEGEGNAISWTYNPLNSCNSGEEARWRDTVVFYKNAGNGIEKIAESDVATEVGAINSCATRNE